MSQRPLIYVAGPYTQGHFPTNLAMASQTAVAVEKAGADAFVPHHASWGWDRLLPHCQKPYRRWMDWCLNVVERCDGLVRIAKVSNGGDMEVGLAKEMGKPIIVIDPLDKNLNKILKDWVTEVINVPKSV